MGEPVTKKEGLSPGKTAESPKEDIWLKNPYVYYTPDSPICQGDKPDFSRNVEWKQTPDGYNQIFLWGLPFSKPTKNPFVAKSRYLAAIGSLLRRKLKEQCREKGLNEHTGCTVNLPCWMCKELMEDTAENGCRFKEI